LSGDPLHSSTPHPDNLILQPAILYQDNRIQRSEVGMAIQEIASKHSIKWGEMKDLPAISP